MYSRLALAFVLFLTGITATSARDARGDTLSITAYRLNLDLSDFTNKTLRADAILKIESKKNGVGFIRLDLLRLTVDSVKVNGYSTVFSYNDTLLSVNLLTTLNAGDSATVQVFYHGHPVQTAGDFGGFYWTNTYAFNIGVSFKAEPHNYGRVWFPCFDNFEERSRFEFWVTTKTNHKAFCNGLLQGVTQNANTKTWHWHLAEPIPSYLASVAVSDYQTLSDTVHGLNGIVPIELAARAADTAALRALFVRLPDALHIQERLWGGYPWERIGYCIVPFNAGAMEHATNISFMQYYLNSLADQCETTMAHELSHHWFGDLVTCADASQMWLNEAWASYNETLFLENVYGKDSAAAYQRQNHEDVLSRAHITDSAYLPINGVPSMQTYGATVYRKGSDAVHTLRGYMGDSLFFHCIKNYLHDYAFTHTTTAQLNAYLDQCSGKNLDDFFADWINAPGFVHFAIEQWQNTDDNTGQVRTQLYIRQRLSHAPHLYQHVPLKVSYFGKHGERYDEIVEVNGVCTYHQSVPLAFAPVYVALDFDEQLQDAATDEWHRISAPGVFDFGTARMRVTVAAVGDSCLLRVVHNWIAPDAMKNPIQGLHLHPGRYWTVEGTFDTSFLASAVMSYDGTASGYLDDSFFTNTEDSLVLLYRPNATADWSFADSFAINTGGNIHDQLGSVAVYPLKKGDYAFAIWNAALPTQTDTHTSCVLYTDTRKTKTEPVNLFPNPAGDEATLRFEQNRFREIKLNDTSGRLLYHSLIPKEAETWKLNLKHYPQGTYFITLTNQTNYSITKKMIKQ